MGFYSLMRTKPSWWKIKKFNSFRGRLQPTMKDDERDDPIRRYPGCEQCECRVVVVKINGDDKAAPEVFKQELPAGHTFDCDYEQKVPSVRLVATMRV